MLHDYLWIFIAGIFLSLASSFGLGANDVANAFGTSVGSKSLSMKWAIIIASVCEFGGALLLGGHVTGTIQSGIADVGAFQGEEAIYMFGMLCVLAATGVWLLLACYLELPVSSTHSVIGGIIGMAMVVHGPGAIKWWGRTPDFPYVDGVASIVASWFISPVLSAAIAVTIFLAVYHTILKTDVATSRKRSTRAFPILVGLTVAIGLTFVLSNGAEHIKFKFKGRSQATLLDVFGGFWGTMALSVAVGFVTGIVLNFVFVPKLKKHMDINVGGDIGGPSECEDSPLVGAVHCSSEGETQGGKLRFDDVHAVVRSDAEVEAVHDAVETFDPATERAFSFLQRAKRDVAAVSQVFTAMCVSFAHGANDVANSIGPLAAIYMIYSEGKLKKEAHVPIWILALGGSGIVLGLAIYGYKIIRAVGVKLAKMSPSRGFSVEMGVAIVIVFGSRCGLPLSTTHCMVGGTVGIGLVQNVRKGVNLKLLFKVVFGWLITMIIVGGMAALMFATGIYAPSYSSLQTINRYENGVAKSTTDLSSVLPDEQGFETSALVTNLTRKGGDISSEQLGLLQKVVDDVKDVCAT